VWNERKFNLVGVIRKKKIQVLQSLASRAVLHAMASDDEFLGFRRTLAVANNESRHGELPINFKNSTLF